MRAITLLLLVACCLAGWWAFSADPVLPPPSRGEQQTTTVAAADAVFVDAESGLVEASADRERAKTTTELDASKAPPIPDDAEWLEVLVVDRANGEPVADAEVLWCNQTQWELLGKLPMWQQVLLRDSDRRAREYGWRTRSDANGLARVTLHSNQVEVIAQKDGLYGRTSLEGKPLPRDGHRIELEPDIALRVKVLESPTEPARGVSVGVTEHDPANGGNRNYWWWNQSQVETDAHGIATFDHMQLRQRHKVDNVEKLVPQWLIHVRSPGLKIEPVAVDAQTPPTEPVEIQLPASGHLRVQLLSGGKPYCDDQVSLYIKPEKDEDGRNTYMAMAQGTQRTPDEHGWLEFRHVGLGQEFRLGSWVWSADILGPIVASEVRTVTVNLDEHAVMIAGRVLRRDGQPLDREMCTLSLHDDKNERQRSMLATKVDGSFLMVMSPGKNGAPLDRMALTVRWEPKDAEGQFAELAPRVLHVGRTDIGEVRLQAASVIVAGRIVPSCEATGTCHVQIERMSDNSGNDNPRWHGVHDVNVHVAADLSFAAYGAVPAGRYRLRVYSRDFVNSEPVEFAVGARDLQIEVACGNKLLVHCLLPEPLTGSHLRVNLLSSTPKQEPRRAEHRSSRAGEADFHWSGLPAGSYNLELRAEGSGRIEPLHRIEGIELPLAGNADGVLPDIDLRSVLSALHLETTLEGDKNGRVLVFVMPQQNEVWQGMHVSAGKSVLPMLLGDTELLVAASGFDPVTLQGVSGSAVATLQRRAKAQIQVLGLEGLPADCRAQVRAKAMLPAPKDDRRYEAGWDRDRLSSLFAATDTSNRLVAGAAELLLTDGSYQLSITVEHRKTSRSENLKQVSPSQIGSSGSYQVQVSPEEVASLVAELAKPAEKKPAK